MSLNLPTVVLLAALIPGASGGAAEPSAEILQRIEQLNAEAAAAYRRGDMEQGTEVARRALDFAEQNFGPEDPKVATALNNLAGFYEARRDSAQAEQLLRRSLAIQEKSLGAEHPDVALTLNNLAKLFENTGDFARAELFYQQALAIAEKSLGAEHPKVALFLNNLAGMYTNMGDYARAEPLYLQALGVRQKALGADHPEVATTQNDLAVLYKTMGDYARAESLLQEGLAIREKALGTEHPAVATSLNNLAELYRAQGDYSRAEPLFQRALAISEQTLGPEHSDVALALNNLAVLYRSHGDNARAEPLYQRSLGIWEKTLGREHPNVGILRDNLATFYEGIGDYTRAESNHQLAVEILEKSLGPDHPALATALNNYAGFYRSRGDYTRAESLYQRALAIKENALGPDHPEVAVLRDNLATFYDGMGDYTRAEPLYQQALADLERRLGPNHPDVADNLDNSAALYWAMGNLSKAITYSARAEAIREQHLRRIVSAGSEPQKRAYAETLTGFTDSTLTLHLQAAPKNADAARLALTTLLQRKGRVLEALTESTAAIRARLSADDQALMNRLMEVRTRLATLVNRGLGKLQPAEYRAQAAELETEADRLEAELSRRSAEFRTQSLLVTLERVQQALPEGSALVELAAYRPFVPAATRQQEPWGDPRFAAYVLFPHGEPQAVDLGEAKPILQTVAALRETLRAPGSQPRSRAARGQVVLMKPETPPAADPARTLDEQVLRRIRKLLGETRTVFLSPDGALNLIPVGALVDEEGRYLIENYHFTYLSSGRDLLRLQVEHEAKGDALVLADPDFGTAGGKSPKSAEERGRRSADLTRGTIQFGPLPGTAQEAKAIAPLLGAQALTRARATESALKRIHQPAVLHVATHGFFLPDQREEPLERGLDRSGPPPAPRTENPLLRSGLALAGANRLQSGNEDGILTALEASGLDLWGTQLVVLSACETGVGKVQNGEGVYGLRRALVNAGAETQVMSLWKVDDAATRDLMVDYYRRLKAGEGRSEALRQAQLAMLHSKSRSDPYHWASFIVSGDWRSLQYPSVGTAR